MSVATVNGGKYVPLQELDLGEGPPEYGDVAGPSVVVDFGEQAPELPHLDSGCPLHDAAASGNVSLLQELFSTSSPDEQEGALANAARKNHLGALRFLLENGVSPRAFRCGPLTLAAKEGNFDQVKLFLAYESSVETLPIGPLRAALQNGHSEVVNEFLSLGMSVSALEADDLTIAAAYGELSVFEHVVIGGDKAQLQEDHFITAYRNGHADVARYIADNLEGFEWKLDRFWGFVSRMGDYGLYEAFADKLPPQRAEEITSATLAPGFTNAVLQSDIETVRKILATGFSIEGQEITLKGLKNNKENTPLIELLLNNGATLSQNHIGYLAQDACWQLVHLFIRHDVKEKIDVALYWAVSFNNLEEAEALINAGATTKNTSLLSVASSDEMRTFLKQHGARPRKKKGLCCGVLLGILAFIVYKGSLRQD